MVRHVRSTDSHGRGPAFTILELLVVVAVLAGLAAILLPALAHSRNRGAAAKCLANLREIGRGCAAYAGEDDQGLLLPVHPIADRNYRHDEGFYDYGGATGAANVWDGFLYGPRSARTAPTRPLNRPLLGHADETGDFGVYRCPSDSGTAAFEDHGFDPYHWDAAMKRQPMFTSVGTSYWGNAWRAGLHPGNGDPESFELSFTPFLRPVGKIPASADTVLFVEALGRYVFQTSHWLPAGNRPPHRALAAEGWHGRMNAFNAALCDGSAREVVFPPGEFGPTEPGSIPGTPKNALRIGGVRFDCLPEPPIVDLPRYTRNENTTSGGKR